MRVTVLIESRRWSSKLSEASGRLGPQVVEDSGGMRRVMGDAYGVRYSRRFGGLSLKTTG
jgi:hypothetical protein